METSLKKLKTAAIIVLCFTVITLVELVSELLLLDFDATGVDAGAMLTTEIFVFVVSVIMLLPRFYIGIKGLKVAADPDSSKAHIVWAVIIFIATIISTASPIIGIVSNEDVMENIYVLILVLIDVVVYFSYIKNAIAVARDAD